MLHNKKLNESSAGKIKKKKHGAKKRSFRKEISWGGETMEKILFGGRIGD